MMIKAIDKYTDTCLSIQFRASNRKNCVMNINSTIASTNPVNTCAPRVPRKKSMM